jgi:hypothetical protein
METSVLAALLIAPVPGWGQAPTAARVKQTAYARVVLAHAIAADPEVRKAVAAKNAEGEPSPAIERRDREWSLAPARRSAFTTGPCADRLREMTKGDALVVEVILMDERGANVCLSRETSDYWQGDEAKWTKTFVEGLDPFVDEPAFDASSATYAVQLSVPVAEGQRRIGALTLTLRVRRDLVEPAAPSPRSPGLR